MKILVQVIYFMGIPGNASRLLGNINLAYDHDQHRLPGGSRVKNQPANAGDKGSIPGSKRSPGEENGNPLQYSCLENSMDRGAWWAIVHRVAEADTTERLTHTPT